MRRKWFLVVFFLFLQSSVYAALELELTQGIDSAIPVAVTPFAGEQSPATKEIADVIRSDIQNSGLLRVLDKDNGDRYSEDASAVHYGFWRQYHIDNLVLGKVVAKGDDRYDVLVQLLETVGKKKVLFNKEFTIPGKDARRLAHHIADLIYQELTGERGIFSTRIAYVVVNKSGKKREFRLEVADSDGHNPQTLLVSSQPIMSPAWSPDAKQIAYVSFENTKSEIYTVDVASGKRRLITSFPGINGAPAWSPDGKKLAIVLSKSGSPNLYLVDMTTRRMKEITKGFSINTEPSWAPDGQSIIFTSNRGGGPQIYQYNLASKAISRLTYQGPYNARASFTPNAEQIVVLNGEGGLFNIAVQDLKSSQMQLLTRSGQSESPTVSPNGKMVLFATQYGGKGVLSMVSIDGRVRLRLPSRDGDVQEPAWEPFRQRSTG